ncbi:MAG TPA: ABC transporter permease [Solirubrobacteraceae bacterium]|jgi:sulfonate transport system permease protein|nr:ABC transporter permease [Solirubrobacteraceae bacterium]
MSTTNPSTKPLGALAAGARAGRDGVAADGAVAPERRRRGLRLPRWNRVASPLLLLAVWQLVSVTGLISATKLPPPTKVISTAYTLITTDSPAYGTLQHALLASLGRVAVGFALGAGCALILATIAGLSRFGEDLVDPLMQMLRTLPLFGLVPVFIVWFGIGQLPKVLLIAIGAAIPLYLNTFAGIRGVDGRLGELGTVLGLRRTELVRHIVLPGALPDVLVGLRQSLGVAWLSLVVAEQLNTNAGLGFIINQGTQFLQNDVIFVALAVYTILGLLTDWMVRVVERRALGWRRGLLVR